MLPADLEKFNVGRVSRISNKMWQLAVIVFVFISNSAIKCAVINIPAYIKPCSKSAADFRQCCINHGNEALPALLKGDKELQIPNLLPLKYPKVEADTGNNLKIVLTNIDLYGLNTATLTDVDVDFGQQTAYLAIHADRVSLIGEYEIDGKIMVLPIKGNGPINITINDSQFKYSFTYKMETKDGVEYGIIQDDDKLEFTIAKANFKLDNLFDGNKQMGDNLNNFLNENDQDVIKELSGVVSGTISKIARRVGGSILATVPFDDLFLA